MALHFWTWKFVKLICATPDICSYIHILLVYTHTEREKTERERERGASDTRI